MFFFSVIGAIQMRYDDDDDDDAATTNITVMVTASKQVTGRSNTYLPSVDVERCYTVIMELNRPTDGTIKAFLKKNNHWIRHLAYF